MRTARARWAVPALLLVLTVSAPPGSGARTAGAAGPPAATASLEPGAIRIGDPARLAVAVEHPAGSSVELPDLARGRALVVVGRRQESEALAAGGVRTTFVVDLTSFETGEHRIGGGEIGVTGEGGRALPGSRMPEVALRVRTVLSGERTPLRGPKEPVRWPASRGWWVWGGAGLLLAAAALLVAGGVRRARRRAPVPPPPPASPDETALKALAALRAASAVPDERVEPYYRELSGIVRRYLEERFGLAAPERTTEEFIREAAGSGLLAAAHQALVRAFLEQCDLVKFARHLPPREEMAAAAAAAERLVRETRPPRAQGPGARREAAS